MANCFQTQLTADPAAMEADLHGQTDSSAIGDTAERFFPSASARVATHDLTLTDIDDLLDHFAATGTEKRQEEIFSGLVKVRVEHERVFLLILAVAIFVAAGVVAGCSAGGSTAIGL